VERRRRARTDDAAFSIEPLPAWAERDEHEEPEDPDGEPD
jgi:hypothetical protein